MARRRAERLEARIAYDLRLGYPPERLAIIQPAGGGEPVVMVTEG